MIETVFRGESLPTRDRCDSWREPVRASHARVHVRGDCYDDFSAPLRRLDLGSIQISESTCPSVRSHRPPRQLHHADPGRYVLSFVRTGTATVGQSGREATIGVGDLLLHTNTKPGLLTPGGRTKLVEVVVPRALLLLPVPAVDRLLATRLPGRHGVGALFTRFVSRLTDDSATYTPADVSRLSAITLDLVTAFLAHQLAAGGPTEGGRHALALRLTAFIDRYLDDPGLTPGRIAAAHHLSVRTLHRHFQQHGTTVAAFVRDRRLERARHHLAHAPLDSRPIHVIASSCGFSRPADFTRAFRAAYGMPPSEYRRLSRQARTGTPCGPPPGGAPGSATGDGEDHPYSGSGVDPFVEAPDPAGRGCVAEVLGVDR
ncbi:helix-turn-helix domain-containing protein [Streptomyces sp. NPDC020965]|uniref:helix-turn-helix domain-containing protein n=1 Tax=Streptomyces sp. NPDC020965 TaxID=3365105 RepID=UPI0037BCA360